jgi:hypothetical protein
MIDAIGDFLHQNLVVLLAVILIPLKIGVIRFCRDHEGEAAAILSLPEDLCYVALGLILSDLLTTTGALHHLFRESKHPMTDIAVVIAINVTVALVIHLISQPAERAYKRWRGSDASREAREPIQGELSFAAAADDDDALHLIVHHLSSLAMLYGSQLILVLVWLHWLAKVIANVPN